MALIVGAIYELWRAMEKRSFFWIVLASLGLLIFLAGHLLDCIPLQSIGWLSASIVLLIILHRNHQKQFRGTGVLIGLLFGLIAFWCAVNGTMYRMERGRIAEGPIEATSVAAYEATQALMMNMAPHNPNDEPSADETSIDPSDSKAQADSKIQTPFDAERVWFTASRIFASLFALFIAYQALTRFARNIAVGTAVASRPPHRSVLEELPHTAPALSRA